MIERYDSVKAETDGTELGDAPVFTNEEWLGDVPIFTNFCGEEQVYDEKNDLSKMHIHEFVEIGFAIEGKGVHLSLSGAHECGVGDVYIINTGVPHKYFSKSVPRELVVRNLLFNPAKILPEGVAISENPDYCYGIFKNNIFMTHLHLEPDMMSEVVRILEKIDEEASCRHYQWQTAVRIHLSNLLITLARCMDSSESGVPSALGQKERVLVSKAMLAVMKNYSDSGLTLEAIAASMYISKSYLSTIFKKATGEYFSEYIRDVRLEAACRLLKNTDKTVEQIVYECGMKDLPSFYRMFKSEFSRTPNQYRKNQE